MLILLAVQFHARTMLLYVHPEGCLDEAVTLIAMGAHYVSVVAGPASETWRFDRPAHPRRAAQPRPVRKAVAR